MKNYLNYINEKSIVSELNITKCEELFLSSPLYDTFMKTNIDDITFIRRKVKSENVFGDKYAQYNIVDPKDIERESPYASSNLYNLVFSNLENWSKLPKRNKSLICGDVESVNRRGGINSLEMIVIPLESVEIGVCSNYDIWVSFDNSLNCYVDNFFENLNLYYGILRKKDRKLLKLSDKDWNKLKDELVEFDKLRITNIQPEISFNKYDKPKYYMDMMLHQIDYFDDSLKLKWKNNEISTLELMTVLFNPKTNNIKSLKYDGTNLPTNREVWTDSKCLLIDKYEINDFILRMKNKYK